MVKAQNENKIDNAPNTVYLSNNLDAKEYERVSIILWNKIWAHELCLNFHSNESNFSNYSFIILKNIDYEESVWQTVNCKKSI